MRRWSNRRRCGLRPYVVDANLLDALAWRGKAVIVLYLEQAVAQRAFAVLKGRLFLASLVLAAKKPTRLRPSPS